MGRRTILGLMTMLGVLLLMACAPPQIVPNGHDQTVVGVSQDWTVIPGELTIENAIGNLTLPTETGAVYLTILNGTEQDDTLIAVAVDGCQTSEIHEVVMQDDVMTMRPIDGGQLLIPAGEVVTLQQGGLHIMCIGKESTFKAGDQVPLTLSFATAGEIAVLVEVRSIDQLGEMSGMDAHQ